MQNSNNLKKFRVSQGVTQQEMADKLGYTLSMYEKVEAGRTGVSSKFMSKFKKLFPNQSIDDIFFAEQPQQNCS